MEPYFAPLNYGFAPSLFRFERFLQHLNLSGLSAADSCGQVTSCADC